MLGSKDRGEKNMVNSGHVRSSLLVVGNRNEADTQPHQGAGAKRVRNKEGQE